MTDTGAKTILLSAGGTGGHLFPAEALAEELLARGHTVVIVTDTRGQAFKTLAGRVEIHTVKAAALKAGLLTKIFACIDMAQGVFQARKLLKTLQPDAIVGFGGYASFPCVFAGQWMGIPTLLHEQNAVLGRANVVLSRKATAIALSTEKTAKLSAAAAKRATVTGNPLRPSIAALKAENYTAPTTNDDFMLFITGGSQAAKIFADVVPAACALLPEDLRAHLYVMHQCRAEDLPAASAQYAAAGIRADLKPFFADMPARLRACHLFIGRGGASSVGEAAAAGRPAIFVPLNHADAQQTHNARSVTDLGGGWLMAQGDFTAPALAEKLTGLMRDPESLIKAAAIAKSCGVTDAAQKLADLVEKTA